jgi:hypothetical protein
MKTRLLAALTGAASCLACAVAAGPALAAGLPVVARAQPPIRWHTGPRAYMTIDLRVSNATSVSVQMTGFVYGSVPRPGLHLYKRTPRFALRHLDGENWGARRTDDASIGAVMSDQTLVAVRACNGSGCLNTDLSFHLPGE